MAMASKIGDCDFSRETSGWCCEGNGNLIGERSYGHGVSKQAAYDDYRRRVHIEKADMIDDDADEAEMVQDEIRREGGDPDNYGTSLRDGLMASADTEAMRERARRLRGEASEGQGR